ncbi:MAG: hypothetical protein ACFFEW_18545, partial [Candidatus Thorarchaeota archaeon]
MGVAVGVIVAVGVRVSVTRGVLVATISGVSVGVEVGGTRVSCKLESVEVGLSSIVGSLVGVPSG